MYPAIQQDSQAFPGSSMISTKGRVLPLKSTELRAKAQGGVARVVLTQVFENPYEEVLTVTYLLPLPADGAVSGFSFVLQDRRVIGEVDRKNKARERYQRALSEGRSAALLEQERSSVFTQEVGNIPPKSFITAEILVDQKLLWLPEGSWEWRFPTVVAPKYLGEAGQVKDAEKISPVISKEPLKASLSFSILVEDRIEKGQVSSTSHELRLEAQGKETFIGLEASATRKNQDIVVRWAVSSEKVGATLSTCRPAIGGLDHVAFGLLTLVPPKVVSESVARDLILLLDVSGSMSGAPIHQLKEVSKALISSLTEQDQLEMIVFANTARRWKKTAVNATEEIKEEAIQWINKLQSSGGTEMKAGIIKALAPLRRDSQRQVIVMTDGHIGSEDEIVKEVFARLPKGSRVHTLGIGSSVNRSLTAPVARAGGGVEQIIGLQESASQAATRLVARTNAPQVVGLRLGGEALLDAMPSRLPDLFGGSPSLLSVKLKPEGGELWVEGYSAEGLWKQSMQVAPLSPNEGNQCIAALYAREAVEDVEMSLAAGKNRQEADQEIENIGVAFQISTRLTSWVAISQEVTVDTEAPVIKEVMPQELPDGMHAAALGLRSANTAVMNRPVAAAPMGAVMKRMAQETLKESLQNEVTEAGESESNLGGFIEDKTRLVTTLVRETLEESKVTAAPNLSLAGQQAGSGAKLEVTRGRFESRLTEDGKVLPDKAPSDTKDIERTRESAPKIEAKEQQRPVGKQQKLVPSAEDDIEESAVADKPMAPPKMPAPSGEKPKEEKKRVMKAKTRGGSEQPGPVSGSAPNAIRLKGIIKERNAKEVVIEFVLKDALDWKLPNVLGHFSDGQSLRMLLNAATSTAAGKFAAGSVIRVALDLVKLAAQDDLPNLLSFSIGGKTFNITLS
jgi:Ca-activated chloride channel family protein